LSPLTAATGELGIAKQGAPYIARALRAAGAGALIAGEEPVTDQPENYWEEKAGQGETGAAIGVAAETGAGFIAPWARDQAVKLADKYNIRVPFLTSQGRYLGRIEQMSQSVPLSGMAVRSQFEQANEDLVRAGYNEALAPVREFGFGGEKYTPRSAVQPGREMAADTEQAISNSYEDVLPRLNATLDSGVKSEIAAIRAGLPERVRSDFDDAVQRNVYNYAHLQPQPGATTGAAPAASPPAPAAASAAKKKAASKAASASTGQAKTGDATAAGTEPVTPAAPTAPPQGPVTFKPSGKPGIYDIYQGDQKVGSTRAKGIVARVPLPGEDAGDEAARIQGVVLGAPRQEPAANPTLYKPQLDALKKAGTDLSAFSKAMVGISSNRAMNRTDIAQIYEGYTGQGAGRLSKAQMIQGMQGHFAGTSAGIPHVLSGENVKFADTSLRDEARSLVQSHGGDRYDYLLGSALGDVRQVLRDAFSRGSAPSDVAQLNATDLAYKRLMILNRASTSSAAPEGVFGPTQLFSAVKAADPTLGKRAMAKGTAEMQDLADTAKTILGKTVADSGTPERAAMMWGAHELAPALGLGAAAAAEPGLLTTMATGIGAHALMYTNPAQAALRGISQGGARTRSGVAGMLRSVSPYAQAALASEQPYANGGSVRQRRYPHARQARDGQWYIPDANRPGKYLQVRQ